MSNEGSSFYYLSKNEPPLINMPVCGAKVPVRHPQQVVFSWLPRNTSSPASAGGTQYELIGSGIEIHNNQKALEATGLLFALYDTFDEVSLSLNLDNIVDYSVDGLGMPNRRYQSQS